MPSRRPLPGVELSIVDPSPPSWWTFGVVYLPIACLPLLVWGVVALRSGGFSDQGGLLAALTTLVVVGAMTSLFRERRQAERTRTDLDRQVRTDPLTGLSNRKALFESLDVWARRAGRLDLALTLLLVDLDDFKSVNDARGHAAGDAVLRSFAEALRQATRSDQDLLFRLGGDEFVVLMIGTDSEGAQTVASRVADRCGRDCVIDEGGATVRCSIGSATRGPGEDIEAWLRRADEAMYAAKPARRTLASVRGGTRSA